MVGELPPGYNPFAVGALGAGGVSKGCFGGLIPDADVSGGFQLVVCGVGKNTLNTPLTSFLAARAKGTKGGKQALLDTGGCYVQPSIFDGVTNHMTIAREEICGPVLSVLSFTDTASVVEQANASIYGLQAGVWTSDINKAHGVARALRAGTVHVNQYDEDDITVPFGGFKQSGVGRDKSLHAFDKYTEVKTTWIRIDSPV